MILGNEEIIRYQKEFGLIELFITENVQPASYDLTLGDTFQTIESDKITLNSINKYSSKKTNSIMIRPKEFILATTNEKIFMPGLLSGMVHGRSSIGRLGLFIQNAGWIDPGFNGKITLELFNATNSLIQLNTGRRICQITFCKVKNCSSLYEGKYNGQMDATASRIEKDFEV